MVHIFLALNVVTILITQKVIPLFCYKIHYSQKIWRRIKVDTLVVSVRVKCVSTHLELILTNQLFKKVISVCTAKYNDCQHFWLYGI